MNEEEKEAIEHIKSELNINDFMSRLVFMRDDIELVLNLIDKQQKEIEELKHFKKEVIDIIKYADDTAEPTYWNIRKLLGLGD